jgi:hypothetical protein
MGDIHNPFGNDWRFMEGRICVVTVTRTSEGDLSSKSILSRLTLRGATDRGTMGVNLMPISCARLCPKCCKATEEKLGYNLAPYLSSARYTCVRCAGFAWTGLSR